jgi:hypothetical protein
MTRLALLNASEAHPLDFELNANQRVQVHACDDHIAAGSTKLGMGDAQVAAECLENFHGEESYLAFVILFKVEEAVAADAAAGDALNLVDLDHGILAGGLSVVAEEVMSRGDEELTNYDQAAGHVGSVED